MQLSEGAPSPLNTEYNSSCLSQMLIPPFGVQCRWRRNGCDLARGSSVERASVSANAASKLVWETSGEVLGDLNKDGED